MRAEGRGCLGLPRRRRNPSGCGQAEDKLAYTRHRLRRIWAPISNSTKRLVRHWWRTACTAAHRDGVRSSVDAPSEEKHVQGGHPAPLPELLKRRETPPWRPRSYPASLRDRQHSRQLSWPHVS